MVGCLTRAAGLCSQLGGYFTFRVGEWHCSVEHIRRDISHSDDYFDFLQHKQSVVGQVEAERNLQTRLELSVLVFE